MKFSISRGKHGSILCEDDNGIITFEAPRHAADSVDRQSIIDFEGGIDVSEMEQWLDSAVLEVQTWLAPPAR